MKIRIKTHYPSGKEMIPPRIVITENFGFEISMFPEMVTNTVLSPKEVGKMVQQQFKETIIRLMDDSDEMDKKFSDLFTVEDDGAVLIHADGTTGDLDRPAKYVIPPSA